MSDLQKNLTAAGASAESAEKIAGIIKAAAQAAALTPVELNRCLRIGADEARRIYYWEKKHAPLLPAGGGERLKEIKKLFTDRGLAADDERFKHILLEAPSLLFLPASTIEDNIKSLCRFPGLPAIDEETYRRAALKQPRLLCLRPQTIADNIRGLVNHPALCGREGKPLLKCREYIAAALKRPQLLYQLPETLAANISGVVSHPALKDDDGKPLFTTETYLQTALKKPQLFLHAPETVVEHVTRFLRHPAFADENGNSLIKAGDYRKAVLRHPALLLQNPDLAAANISGVVNHPLLAAADGSPLTSRAEYVRAALKQASLFIITPDTVVGKINGIIRHPDLSGTDGRPVIDKAACLKAALKMPALFVILPETIAANVNGVVRHPALQNEQGQPMFKREDYIRVVCMEPWNGWANSVNEDYIRAAIRQPSLLVQAPQTVAEHVTIIKDLLLKEEICPDTAAVADFCLTNPITMVLGSDNLKSRYLYAYAKRRCGEKPGKKIIADTKGKMRDYLAQSDFSADLPERDYERLYRRHRIVVADGRANVLAPRTASVYGIDIIRSLRAGKEK